jgi:hypothetical protein
LSLIHVKCSTHRLSFRYDEPLFPPKCINQKVKYGNQKVKPPRAAMESSGLGGDPQPLSVRLYYFLKFHILEVVNHFDLNFDQNIVFSLVVHFS